MKIDAPRGTAWWIFNANGPDTIEVSTAYEPVCESWKVRIVRESDWRKIMAVVKAAEQDDKDGRVSAWATYPEKIADLRKHLEKRRARSET